MSFMLGNIPQTNVAENILAAMNKTDARVYGVNFPYGTNGAQCVGQRLYTASSMRFIPSALNAAGTAFTAGLDDFATQGPFKQRECAMQYDSTNDEQALLGYKDEMSADEWATLITPDDVNIMIEFPKFWYCRPQKYEFVVTDQPIEGFLPSPMHYRNGTLFDFAYVSKYLLSFSSDQSTYYSRSGKRGLYQYQQESIGTTGFNSDSATVCTSQIHRNKLRPYKWYSMDYAAYTSILMLALIKYGTTNFMEKIAGGVFTSASASSGIKSTGTMDNCPTLDGGTPNVYTNSEMTLGIENLYGNAWKSVDGLLQSAAYIYINTDIENLAYWPDSTLSGWTKVSKPMPTNTTSGTTYYHIADMVYPSDCLFAMWAETNTTDSTAAKFPRSGQYYAAGTNAAPKKLYTGGGADHAPWSGPFTFGASRALSGANWNRGLLGFSLRFLGTSAV